MKNKYVVIINHGGGLWDKVIKMHSGEKFSDDPSEYWDRSGEILYTKDEEDDGRFIRGFDTESEAKLFLDGAKAFKKFLMQYLNKH